MKNRRKLLLSITILMLGISFIVASVCLYSAVQLRTLKSQMVYASPEDGMRALIANNYAGVSEVEITKSGKEMFDDLYFVEAQVCAISRYDLKGLSYQSHDNPGYFFLEVEEGWVFVPEGKFPEVIALGKRVFRLSV